MADPKIEDPRLHPNVSTGSASSKVIQSLPDVPSRGAIGSTPSKPRSGSEGVGTTSLSGLRGPGASPPVRTATPAYSSPAAKPPDAPVRTVTPSSPPSVAPPTGAPAPGGRPLPLTRTMTPSAPSNPSSIQVAAVPAPAAPARTLTPSGPSAASVPGRATMPRSATPANPSTVVTVAVDSSAPVRTMTPAIRRESPDPPAAQPAPKPATPAKDKEVDGSGSSKTILLDGSMLEAVRARAGAVASGIPVQKSIPTAVSSPASSPSVVSTMGTAISVGTARPVPSTTLRSARPAVLAANYRVVPARIEATPFALSDTDELDLPMLMDGSTERAAAFRALRRRLAEQKDPRAILVTSAQDGEGKTTCAANLALALAESGRLSVLLVEANLRRPRLAEIFGLRQVRSFDAQMAAHREQIDAPWLTTELRPTALHVLAVAPDAIGGEGLHGPTFSASIARWRCAFDYVVVDGPSILQSGDISIIHDSVDAVVMVVRSGVHSRTVRRALEQISVDMVAGMVLMDGAAG